MAAFLFDNDADLRIARWLHQHGHSVISLYDLAPGLGLHAASDREVLLHAAISRLILVTHNEDDYVVLHDTEEVAHAGILALEQVRPGGLRIVAEATDRLIAAKGAIGGELYRWTQEQGRERRLPTRVWERL